MVGDSIVRAQKMRKQPPRTHPAPHQSRLWPHWQMIGEARRRKKTWGTITKELEETHGIKLTAGTVRNFFKRAAQGRLPLGVLSKSPVASMHATPTVLARATKPFEEPDGDPFSVKVIEFDPWKPQTRNKAS
jgi:hypothetical protein